MNSSDIIDDGEKCIQKLLWRLRHEDATQYNTLVKMHLSFATDLPTDQRIAVHIRRCDMREQPSGRRWHLTPLIRRLGRSGNGKGVMEGAPLTQEGVCQAFQLIHYLNKDYNITQEGLFRKSGSLTRQQELKSLLNSGGDLNLDYGVYSAHDCASVLKSFLADLPEPLLTEAHYSIHCKIAEMHQSHMSQEQKEAAQSRQVKALRLLFLLLPSENYQLLQDLLILLNRVAAHKEQNLMSAINLGTMFAPHILCPRKMAPNDLQYLSGTLSTSVAFMIENQPQLFKVPLELEYDVRQYWNNKKRMKHQLSKRSMMDAPTNTIFTFIDRELTAQANDKDVTEVALAELYAYVQSLPDSAKKRRLIKQFNHASGSGTPQLNQSFLKRQEARGKRLGDSIKKHLFHKNVKNTKNKSQPFSSVGSVRVKRTNSEDLLSSPSTRSPELRMFRRNADTGTPDRLRAKSLDDLSSPSNEYLSSGKNQMIIHPASFPKPIVWALKTPYPFPCVGTLSRSDIIPPPQTKIQPVSPSPPFP
ncbi:rho GTPase-activating protein 19-like isoform X4 [Penaeus chinensis]|uniref:rho GTPase-activating protein 19-like isoform X4 n=1 Tax=Penaeus chinensis TaxID=139456 RepID=UPI001FB76298|nr:rho GTPase-activating protein 19-like isoform X4 [Penaeus chinensis]